ncbi:hypothetical protein MAM1_0259c08847 [Mucor ambiguus]|uniref:Rab-GAP TBC domain-containing protein n=1 Tax=Mucor ambiguus TaxID=91626 RepID=A0A0C9N0A5_9FUNG|nr:hypothetical protein MAM1_0259c08847 [Mucor ambiguus]
MDTQQKDDNEDGLFYRLQKENALVPPQDSTAFILAQIERQNILLEKDPKSIYIQSNELKAHFSTVQKLVKVVPDDHPNGFVEEEEIDWGFWEAVIQDSDQVALRLPHLLSLKLRSGIPTRVRGLMWQAMSKSASLHLETVYKQLCKEKSPHERIIQRDLARTFPRIDMFKQENGQGQSRMKRILESYSLYDPDVGYCQGLAFLVGPLLMNIPETQSFCVFVRLMETYEMRSMFTLNMEGLQLRLYQFSSLLHDIVPKLAHYLDSHAIHPAMYASQWFLTLFAYAFPIPLIERIYDIIFAEGAAETIMRVAIAMLKRSEDALLYQVNSEFEDVLDFITSKKLCDPYTDNYGHVIRDAMALSDMITRAKMDSLATKYAMMSEEEKVQLQQAPQVTMTTTNSSKVGFWRRRRLQTQQQSSATCKKPDIQRSASAAGASTSSTTMSATSANKPPLLKKRWSSVSSPRGWNDNKPPAMPSTATPPSSSSSSTAVTTQVLTAELQDLKATHIKTLARLDEIEHDKQDLECERDALKLTIAELERCRQQQQQQKKPSEDSPIMLPTATSYISSPRSSRKNSTASTVYTEDDDNAMTPATSLTFYYPHHHPQQHDKELIHVKVKNYELEQQCEKLSHDLEMTQSKFDMVNEGQMALIETLVSLKVELEELKQENVLLKKNAMHDPELVEKKPSVIRRHSTTGVVSKDLDGVKLQELKSTLKQAMPVTIATPTTAASITKKSVKKKSSSTSIYGRMLHAFSKQTSSTQPAEQISTITST